MSWVGKYIGIPFKSQGRDWRGCDCWGLVRLIYQEELLVCLPEYGEISATDLKEVSRNITDNNACEPWYVVDSPKVFDVAVMRFYGSKHVGHVGVVVDSQQRVLLHTEKGHDSVLTPFDHSRIRTRLVGFRRYRGSV